MITSRYLRTLEKNAITAIFHALDPFPFFVPTEIWSEYTKNTNLPKITKQLIAKKLLVNSSADDDKFFAKIYKENMLDNIMSILYLMLTKRCNFRCRQCFQVERHYDYAPKKLPLMSRKVAKLGIDAFVRHIKQSGSESMETQIEMYGGEPLLNWPVFQFAVKYIESLKKAKQLPDNTVISVVTNGSLINNEIAIFLKHHSVSVGLSIDGPRDKNDEYRLTLNGEATYDIMINALKILQKNNIDVSLSVTINPNIANMLPDIIHWAKNEMMMNAISFNLIGGKSYGYTKTNLPKSKYDELVANGLVEAFKVAREIDLVEDRFNRKVKHFIDQKFMTADCGAIGNQLVIQPEGEIAFCHASERYNLSTVFNKNFTMFGHPAIEEWKQALPIINSECQSCPAIAICGYGCFHNVIEEGRNLTKLDKQFCLHTKRAMDFLVWDLYQQCQKGDT